MTTTIIAKLGQLTLKTYTTSDVSLVTEFLDEIILILIFLQLSMKDVICLFI